MIFIGLNEYERVVENKQSQGDTLALNEILNRLAITHSVYT